MRMDRPDSVTKDAAQYRVEDLNREMLRLPMEERRKRWKEYYDRLALLTPPLAPNE